MIDEVEGDEVACGAMGAFEVALVKIGGGPPAHRVTRAASRHEALVRYATEARAFELPMEDDPWTSRRNHWGRWGPYPRMLLLLGHEANRSNARTAS